ncbi:hypothetical protein [Edaphocola aurantiacus]|uniref:hypothetical protein n=1 Tax=Edaphocola aurantiacus TaxID=2601682 RepID=UPI001C9806BD|nr:hypothetical protein [Edaphocola aurantiacus]
MRTLTLSVLLLLNSVLAKAQSLTVNDIKGEWTMVAFEMSDIYYEWGIDSLALGPNLKSQVTPENEKLVVDDIKKNLQPFIDGHLIIKGDGYYMQKLMGEEADGNYTLIKKGGAQYLRVINNNKNKDVDELKVEKKKGWLYISMNTEEGETILIFEKD